MEAKRSFRPKVVAQSALIVAGMAIVGGVIVFLHLRISAEVNAILERRAAAATQEGFRGRLVALRKQAGEAEIYGKNLAVLLPNQDQIYYFREWLRSFAQPYGLEPKLDITMTTMPTQAMPGFTSFRFSVRGPYQNMIDFLKKMTANRERYFVSLDNFDFKQVGLGESSVTVEGKAFFK